MMLEFDHDQHSQLEHQANNTVQNKIMIISVSNLILTINESKFIFNENSNTVVQSKK